MSSKDLFLVWTKMRGCLLYATTFSIMSQDCLKLYKRLLSLSLINHSNLETLNSTALHQNHSSFLSNWRGSQQALEQLGEQFA